MLKQFRCGMIHCVLQWKRMLKQFRCGMRGSVEQHEQLSDKMLLNLIPVFISISGQMLLIPIDPGDEAVPFNRQRNLREFLGSNER